MGGLCTPTPRVISGFHIQGNRVKSTNNSGREYTNLPFSAFIYTTWVNNSCAVICKRAGPSNQNHVTAGHQGIIVYYFLDALKTVYYTGVHYTGGDFV